MAVTLSSKAQLLVDRFSAQLPDSARLQSALQAANVGDAALELHEAKAALFRLLPDARAQIETEASKVQRMGPAGLRAALANQTDPLSADLDRAVMTSILPPAHKINVGEKKAFNDWIIAAHDTNAQVKAVTSELAQWLKSSKPTRVADVLQKAIMLGEAQVEAMPNKPAHPLAQAHLAAGLAILGAAPIAIFARGGAHRQMPAYIQDGRANDAGHDKSRHLFAQAMFAWVVMYDEKYGDGETANAFIDTVDKLDAQGAAEVVRAEYHRREGAIGSFLTDYKPSPKEEGPIPYQPRPEGLNEVEARAYDGAVRMGDFYEWASSGKPSLDKIGAPTGTIDGQRTTEGMADPGTVRDMTANRVGAKMAVELFRKPQSAPKIPWDGSEPFAKPYA